MLVRSAVKTISPCFYLTLRKLKNTICFQGYFPSSQISVTPVSYHTDVRFHPQPPHSPAPVISVQTFLLAQGAGTASTVIIKFGFGNPKIISDSTKPTQGAVCYFCKQSLTETPQHWF